MGLESVLITTNEAEDLPQPIAFKFCVIKVR